MKDILLGCSNFWGHSSGFTAEYFYRMFPFLREHYNITVTQDEDAPYMMYSVYGYVQKKAPNSVRILISGEAGDHFDEGGKMAPGEYQKGFYHYGLTCAYDNVSPNHVYLPQPYIMLNLYNDGWKSLIRDGSKPPGKTKFCDFIYSNACSVDRIDFMVMLSQLKLVSCAGAVRRNCHDLVGTGYDGAGYLAKQAFQSKHKFSIAFENNYFPGYTTEKLSDPLVARSLPIYLGNPKVHELFNKKAFINVANYENWTEALDYIRYVDENDFMYDAYMEQPPFVDNKVPDKYSDEMYLAFFKRIFA